MVVSLPTIARDLNLSESLLLWPAAVSSLSCGCTLLVCGSISDVVGGRRTYLLGTAFLAATTIACALARNGVELIAFRTAQGLAMAFCLPSSVLLITSNIPEGHSRNIAFACLGAGQPVGFGAGLVIGGLLIECLNWRSGYYIGSGLTFAIFLASIFALPADIVESVPISIIFRRMGTEVDWFGCFLLSTSLGLFSYIFAVLATCPENFLHPTPSALFVVALLLIPKFAYWIHRQERLGRKAVIPPSLWTNRLFTSLCVIVFFVWGCFNATQYFITLYFQLVEDLSPVQTAVRFLPQVIVGAVTNLMTGWLVKHVRANYLIIGSCIITSICPLLMATIDPSWSYWHSAFFALCFIPVCADVLFPVGNLLIVSLFPPETHGLAGGVFNTVSNIGNSVGLAVTAMITTSVTRTKIMDNASVVDAMLGGYRASFLTCFAAHVLVLVIVVFGMRNVGKVGVEAEKGSPMNDMEGTE